ncbi:hypothetical protein CRM22_003298 [Opisthorchis felineus]|uniref:Uncharacterized protein n=2 Tax=Opisthorchis felineus TaxID=147828 RepID=A0A4S2M214_OPIFE|nr:hypothetical protein CRM22_003298 [Opisthorchis felineus]
MMHSVLLTTIISVGLISAADYRFYALTQAGLVDICQQISALKHPWWKKVSCLPIGAVQSLKAFELKLDQSDVWSEYVSRTLLAADIARGLSYNMGRCGVVVANVALLNTMNFCGDTSGFILLIQPNGQQTCLKRTQQS